MSENVDVMVSSQTNPFQYFEEPNDAETTQKLPYSAVIETTIGLSLFSDKSTSRVR